MAIAWEQPALIPHTLPECACSALVLAQKKDMVKLHHLGTEPEGRPLSTFLLARSKAKRKNSSHLCCLGNDSLSTLERTFWSQSCSAIPVSLGITRKTFSSALELSAHSRAVSAALQLHVTASDALVEGFFTKKRFYYLVGVKHLPQVNLFLL